MNVGLIDNELCTRKNHSFPNLAIMKLSSFHKKQGDDVKLISFNEINPNCLFTSKFDIVYVSKVFSDTPTPDFIHSLDFIKIGGSGFYYDKAECLPYDIEHSFPDYDIYSNIPTCNNSYYTDYSIGFLTRGCIRQCSFCINRNSKKVEHHSNIEEFYDNKRPYIMLLDDNITAYSGFYDVFDKLDSLNTPFVFKQGMDFRLLSEKKMIRIQNANYYSGKKKGKQSRTFFYAFDNIEDYNIIEKKLKIYMSNMQYRHNLIFYVLVGFDRQNLYDDNFYKKDIEDMFKRIKLLFENGVFAYIMMHENYIKNPNSEIIQRIKRICNVPMHIAGKTIGNALIQMKYHNTYKWIEQNYDWFLNVKQGFTDIKIKK